MQRLKNVGSVLACALVAAGCSSPQLKKDQREIESRVPVQVQPRDLGGSQATFGSPDRVEGRTLDFQSRQLVRASNQPWVGGMRSVPRMEDRLPAVFNETYTFEFSRNTSLPQLAARLTQMTGVPVRVRDDVFMAQAGPSDGAPVELATLMPAPIAGQPLAVPASPPPQRVATGASVAADALSAARPITVHSIPMNFKGRLRDFLDQVTNSLSLAWEFSDGAVVLMRLITQSYDVAAFPGTQTFSMSAGASGGGSASEDGVNLSTTNRTAIQQQGSMNVRESLLKTVQDMVAQDPGSSVTMSDGSGRIVVVASKETQSRVRAFLDLENKALRRMVNVTFDIYSVRTRDQDQAGVDWSSVFQSLSNRYGVSFRTPASLTETTASQLGVNIISSNGTTNSRAMVTLLSQFGQSTQHRPVSITTLNGQWDTKSRLSTDGYLKETVPGTASATGGSGAPGLKTDTVTTGDQFSVLPYVQNDNTVMIKYSISLSDLLGLFDVSTGAGETLQKVQTPRIDAINASSTVLLAPGETAVITGLSRLVSKDDQNRLTRQMPVAAGGSLKAEVSREHFLVLMRATPL